MQITGKALLNSAESILKDRKGDASARPGKTEEGSTSAARPGDRLELDGMENRLLSLQKSLGDLQNQYTREQTRQSYLNQYSAEVSPELMFQGEPLFPELQQGKSLKDIQTLVAESLNQLTSRLRKTEVEMENLYALNVDSSVAPRIGAEDLNSQALRNIDPGRVARLTRDSQ
ncbi:MAG: hypothetical protein CMN77_12825 [Spirochaetaceae bacterium]|nr:hypothetical protein [Spirochaetaceae bacterium]|tara:strand:+ start:18940 stop:19458 length:519 start_codon:yes stop_codon:yes gene_type:complete